MRETGLLRGTKVLSKLNQMEGFDCPGCAWPDPDDRRSLTEFCENGVKAVAEEATRKKITPAFFEHYAIAELEKKSDFWLSQEGRLTSPMVVRDGGTHYESISWDEAFALMAEELNCLHSPDEALFYTSGRTSNEAAFLYQLFVRMFGTNNLPDCSNMCHESSGVGLTEVIGLGKGTVTLEDFEHSDCIIVMGQNPGTNHPRMLTALEKASRNGAKIIAINPLFEAGLRNFRHPQQFTTYFGAKTELTTHYLPVRINGDAAVLQGIMNYLLTHDLVDRSFVKAKTTGFEVFKKHIEAVSWKIIEEQSGLKRQEIEEVAKVIGQSQRVICCWAMGLTQHRNSVAIIQDIVNLLLLGGHFGRQGAGACPVRGHSNVQGDRTVGIWERPTQKFLYSLERVFHFKPPQEPGHAVVSGIEAMAKGEAKVLIALGGNLLSAAPDTEVTAQALRRCRLTVHVSTKLNRSHLVHGERALILPVRARSEIDEQGSSPQFVTVENSMGIVHRSQGNLKPASKNLISEVDFVCRLAAQTFHNNREKKQLVDWATLATNYDAIRDLIEQTLPAFEKYNERVRSPAGFYLPNAVRDDCHFDTPEGKARFTVHDIPLWKLEPNQFLMMTMRTHDQYNTTIYGLDDRYRGLYEGRRVILLNAEDMKKQDIRENDLVDIISHFQGTQRIALGFTAISYPIPKSCAATFFPEANELVPLKSTAIKSHTPTSKSVVISLKLSNTN